MVGYVSCLTHLFPSQSLSMILKKVNLIPVQQKQTATNKPNKKILHHESQKTLMNITDCGSYW